MKTIKTKVTPDQIMALEKLMEQLVDFKPPAISNKVVKSVLEDVADKIHVRYRKIIKSADLFNAKKTIGLELKYHEAASIYTFIQMSLCNIHKEEKAYNDLLKLSNYLHQKLI
ncbi:hypothetical protein QLS31_07055 [Flavobacterium sp. XS2P24]|uniref:hypothetical protein n=1 Tax=Flavobacterium sp. XS2P24 TaxID=3041249 RepID=UPI0024A9D10D|nr:hypothetical protein [Flavobacterium sp. XS2P24]MDI6049584.1 hypothetical protein [Flavobacterium sp. XS2P24]